jgi:hypothetical protein
LGSSGGGVVAVGFGSSMTGTVAVGVSGEIVMRALSRRLHQ